MELLLIIALSILGIILLVILIIQDKNNKKFEAEKREMQEEYNKVVYRYKNAEGKSIDKYLETPEQRLFRIYRSLSYKSKQKLLDYADTLERRENE